MMKYLVKLEELGMFLLSVGMFSVTNFEWWWFPALLLVPDISMAGYLFGNRAGAILYNLFHHKATGIGVFIFGFMTGEVHFQLAGAVLFGHSSLDRIFGYGLKYFDSFTHTHLGRIGKQ